MTPQDLEQMRTLLREEVGTIVRQEVRIVVREEVQAIVREEVAAVEQRLNERVAAVGQNLNERVDRSAAALIGNVSDLRAEMVLRFEQVEKRFQGLDLRMNRFENLLNLTNYQLGGMDKSIGDGQRLTNEVIATQMAEQKLVSDLAARVRAIEQRLGL